jgi:outer membrane protein TolC
VGGAHARLGALEARARGQAVTAAVDEAVSRWLLASRRVRLLEPLVERARVLRAQGQAARRRETVTGFDARLLDAEATGMESQWMAATQDRETSAEALRRWLGLPADSALSITDDLDREAPPCGAQRLVAEALARRADLARAAAAETLALRRSVLARREARSRPSIGVSWARERVAFDDPGGPWAERDDRMGVEVRMPLPLANARAAPEVAEALWDFERMRAERLTAQVETEREVATACVGLNRARERMQLLKRSAEVGEGDLVLVDDAYRGGRVTLEGYLTLRDRLVRRQLEALDALDALEAGRLRLARAVGVGRAELDRMEGGER